MALDWLVTYAGRVLVDALNYPLGKARDVTIPLDGTGTPWEELLIRDWSGFFQKLIVNGIGLGNESGVPDTVVASDYYDSMIAVTGGAGGSRTGLVVTRDSTVLMTAGIGAARNQADTVNLVLPVAMQKDISATWVQGDTNGGLPDGLALTADTWYRRFLITKPDGTADWAWDTSPTAANIFADANVVAAGFSDVTRYRRFGWTFVDAGSTIQDHINSIQDPSRYYWNVTDSDFVVGVSPVPNVARAAITLSNSVPPDCFGDISWLFFNTTSSDQFRISTAAMADLNVSTLNCNVRLLSAGDIANIKDLFEVDSNQQLFVRADWAADNEARGIVYGWKDTLAIP